jgi:hypothetical protein
MIQLLITQTRRAAGLNQAWYRYGHVITHCATPKEAREFLRLHYGKRRRSRMYADKTHPPRTEHVGWIYHWLDHDHFAGTPSTFYYQDWVEIRQVTCTHINPHLKD